MTKGDLTKQRRNASKRTQSNSEFVYSTIMAYDSNEEEPSIAEFDDDQRIGKIQGHNSMGLLLVFFIVRSGSMYS